jgi:MFS family permease
VARAGGAAALAAAMVCFGFSKGLYESNIFAALFDSIEPRARGTAAGVMNTVGWSGGALGPLAIGFAAQYGRHGADQAANMADGIAACSWVYAACAALLFFAAFRLSGRRA